MEINNIRRDVKAAIGVPINGGNARIRIPKHLIPSVNFGGSDGGWQLDDVMVGHTKMRGRFPVNGLNQPTVAIDRHDGTTAINRLLKFKGRCEQNSGRRRF